MFEEWLDKYEGDKSDKHRDFFGYLKANYEDFSAYRKIAETGGACCGARCAQVLCLSLCVRLLLVVARALSPNAKALVCSGA